MEIPIFNLDPQQLTVQKHILTSVHARNTEYNLYTPTEINNDDAYSDFSKDDEEFCQPTADLHDHEIQPDCKENVWTRPILVTGKPGSGKSHTILPTVQELLKRDATIFIAAPTEFLALVYWSQLPDGVVYNTVHASFHYPVECDESCSINWDIEGHDIIINELSMIPGHIFNHVLKPLNVNVLACHPSVWRSSTATTILPTKSKNHAVT